MMAASLRKWAKGLRQQALVVYYAARDPRTPWFARVLALAVTAYALSPIDLIPDFIPVLGYLDDLIIVLLGVALVIRLIPPEIMARHRATAEAAQSHPVNRAGAIAIIVVWLLAAGIALTLLMPYLRRWF